MKYLYLYLFCLKDTIAKLRNNKLINGITILTISITLSIVSVFYLFLFNLNNVISLLSNKIQIVVYLNDSGQSNRTSLETAFSKMEEIRMYKYASKEDALARFKVKFKEHAGLIDSLGYYPLPDSYTLVLNKGYISKARIEAFVNKLGRLNGIQEIDYGREWINSLDPIISIGRFLVLSISIFLLGGMIFIVANTIKLSLYNYANEIEIMRLVGAQYWVIKVPFLVQGLIQGFIGALLSLGIVYMVYVYIFNNVSNKIAMLPAWFDITFFSLHTIIIILISGTLIGILGSLISLRRIIDQ